MRRGRSKATALAGSLVMALCALVAAAADKKIPLDNGDTVLINWRDGWTVGAPPKDAPVGTLVFQAADVTQWQASLVPMPAHPSLTSDTGNLRIYVRGLVRQVEESGVEVDAEQKSIEGPNLRGFYVTLHDPKQKPGEYTDGYVGAVSIDSKPYVFEVLWNPGGEAGAREAFAALKSVRIQ